MIKPALQDRLDAYVEMWKRSQPASRVDQVEGFSINHGFEQYEGQTIPDFLMFVLNDLLVFVAQQPDLLQGILGKDAADRASFQEIMALAKEMNSYFFGILDPRYRRAQKRILELSEALRAGDLDYNKPVDQ